MSGTATGNGFEHLSLAVTQQGRTVLAKSFSVVAAANSFFDDTLQGLGAARRLRR